MVVRAFWCPAEELPILCFTTLVLPGIVSLANFCCLIWNEGLFALMPLGKVIQLTTKFEVKITRLT